MARKSEVTDDPTEDLVEEMTAKLFTPEELSDIIAHNVARGLLHLPSHIRENAATDNSKE